VPPFCGAVTGNPETPKARYDSSLFMVGSLPWRYGCDDSAAVSVQKRLLRAESHGIYLLRKMRVQSTKLASKGAPKTWRSERQCKIFLPGCWILPA
jgi:hypothetical protein